MTGDSRAKDRGWEAVFNAYNINEHDFTKKPFEITARQIKDACQHFRQTAEKEVRILCTQTTRKMRPRVFQDNGLFLLPVKNGAYVIVQGEGYVDIPPITAPIQNYAANLEFELLSAEVGSSEMQHLDYANAVSVVRHFAGDSSLILTIRGRKYTPRFSFTAGGFDITAEGVQTEVDSGYEGRGRVVIVEAKNSKTTNTIIRQLYYPYRQWGIRTGKNISTVFFERQKSGEYCFWEFVFDRENDYNSIRLSRSARYRIV